MGIKGLFAEIFSGEDVALAKLSLEHYRQYKTPLRIAVDVSIWSFQSQTFAPKNNSLELGSNSGLRVLYFRLLRLLELHIEPVFVFDGKNRPNIKRDKSVGSGNEAQILQKLRKLIPLFGFQAHDAPGEAEAECAHLQKLGIVDAVLSEDIDCLMFGCGVTLVRSAKEKGKISNVTVYDLEKIKLEDKLSTTGMILVALLSSGDYNTAGVRNCGVKIAVAAAKAGYGETLIKACESSKREEDLIAWRTQLDASIRSNSEKIFARKTSTIHIPSTFPDQIIVNYYTKPLVTSISQLPIFRWGELPDTASLRAFTQEYFQWDSTSKFIRTITLPLLNCRLRTGSDRAVVESLILDVHSKRRDKSTGFINEARCSIVAVDVVGIALDHKNVDEDTPIQDDGQDDEEDAPPSSQGPPVSPSKRKPTIIYDPRNVERVWIAEDILRIGAQRKIELYEQAVIEKAAAKAQKAAKKMKAPTVPDRQITEFFSVDKGSIHVSNLEPKILELNQMGFGDNAKCLQALRTTQGSLDKAVDLLFQSSQTSLLIVEEAEPAVIRDRNESLSSQIVSQQSKLPVSSARSASHENALPKLSINKDIGASRNPKPVTTDEDWDLTSSDVEFISEAKRATDDSLQITQRGSEARILKTRSVTQPSKEKTKISSSSQSSVFLPQVKSSSSRPTAISSQSKIKYGTSKSQNIPPPQKRNDKNEINQSAVAKQSNDENDKMTMICRASVPSLSVASLTAREQRVYRSGRPVPRLSAPGQWRLDEGEGQIEVMDLS